MFDCKSHLSQTCVQCQDVIYPGVVLTVLPNQNLDAQLVNVQVGINELMNAPE